MKWQVFKTVASVIISILIGVAASAQKLVTMSSLLNEMVDVSEVSRWPDPFYKLYQASSYDRKSIAPEQSGWFANADASQFIRTELNDGHKEYVMLDADGPGAIVRFWLTTFKREGILRIYFDNQLQPEIKIPAYDLMKIGLPLGKALLTPHSSYEAKEKGGSTLYLPMPFSKHCKVTWEDAEPEVKQPRYYQINYRKYSAGTAVSTFTIAQFHNAKRLADKVNLKLLKPANIQGGKTSTIVQLLEAGKTTVVKLPVGSNAVKLLQVKISSASPEFQAQALRSTILKIKFDDDQTVWCPVGDFSGSGVGGKQLQSWYRTVTDKQEIVSRWVMPYQHSAEISLINTANKSVKVQLTATTQFQKWTNNTMYFHANWKAGRNVEVKKSEEDKPDEWNFNTITGKGVYIGDTFAVYNHMHTWYGEGDQKLWVDNEKFPSEFGTGTEDYYNTSWAPVVLYQTPFANAPRADNAHSFGYNTFTRTRILDAVPFLQAFRFNLEMLGWQNGTIDISAVTYWYGLKGAKSILKENKQEAAQLLP